MKINSKILSIPPYISTCWSNVTALHMKDTVLFVGLMDGDTIEIPKLKADTIELLFNTHAAFLEEEHGDFNSLMPNSIHNKLAHPFAQAFMNAQSEASAENPFRLSFSSLDELGSVLQHNPQQANAPELPPEILQKISAITKIIAPEESQNLPKPEPHCNCIHCQIARAVQDNLETTIELKQISPIDEVVKEEELAFQQWEIKQSTSKLFTVINRLDTKEYYNVHLGNPVGCTCGQEGCEHIIAVLKS